MTELPTERKILQAKRACLYQERVFFGKACRFYHPCDEGHLKRLNLLLAQGHFVNPELEQLAFRTLDESREILIEVQWQGEKRVFSIVPQIVSQPWPFGR